MRSVKSAEILDRLLKRMIEDQRYVFVGVDPARGRDWSASVRFRRGARPDSVIVDDVMMSKSEFSETVTFTNEPVDASHYTRSKIVDAVSWRIIEDEEPGTELAVR